MLKRVIIVSLVLLVLSLVACLYLNVDALPKQFVMPKGPAVNPGLKPDLVVSSISVQPQPPRFLFGGNGGEIRFAIKNQGPVAVGGGVRCKMVGRGASDDVKVIPGPIAAGEEKSGEFIVGRTGQNSASVGVYDQYVIVDPDNQIDEVNENNNLSGVAHFEVYQPLNLPDLIVIPGPAPRIPFGSREPVTFKVKNIGNQPTPGNTIKCRIQGRADQDINGPLQPGAETTVSFDVSARPAGFYDIPVTVNSDRRFEEGGDRANNTALVSFEVLPQLLAEGAAVPNSIPVVASPSKPDLVITREPNPTISATYGEIGHINFKVINQSEVDIPEDIQFGVTVTSNLRRNFGPVRMRPSTVPLAHRQERSISFGVGGVADFTPDVYKVEIIADPNNRIAETTKNNNKLIVWLQVNPREGGAEY